jgi:ATP-dependent Clp protease ATP-binding subunit ClpB
VDVQARAWLADQGYDSVFGARPLKRVIQHALQDPLAEMILSGDVSTGQTLEISAKGDGLMFGDKVFHSTQSSPDSAILH